MPPKKGTNQPKAESKVITESHTQLDVKNESNGTSQAGHKRKKSAADDEPQKAARRSERSATKSQPSQHQLLNFMLSETCEDLCRPEDEITCHEDTRDIRTYSGSALNPFEELLSAIILSRPISHRLGLRTISTILNAPYHFNSARAVRDAGREKHLQAVWDARTQHKDKTAGQIGLFADVVLEKFTSSDDEEGTRLSEVREVCDRDVEKKREFLRSHVKGLGETGLDIIFRRVQWLWTAGFPFVDDRTARGLGKLGLPDDGQELWKAVQEHWGELETRHLAGEDEDVRKRRAFVVVLERATGADLEGKADALVQKAAAV